MRRVSVSLCTKAEPVPSLSPMHVAMTLMEPGMEGGEDAVEEEKGEESSVLCSGVRGQVQTLYKTKDVSMEQHLTQCFT